MYRITHEISVNATHKWLKISIRCAKRQLTRDLHKNPACALSKESHATGL